MIQVNNKKANPWVSLRSILLSVEEIRRLAYLRSRGNFHLSICVYIILLPALVLLSQFHYNPFGPFRPGTDLSSGKHHDKVNFVAILDALEE